MVSPNTNLERYELLERIAIGGMAEVFRAKASGAHGFEKTLAIKRILPELARDPEFEQRFINEAKLAVKLSHANVVQVFDFGRFSGSLFIAMEFVEGLDLAAFLKVYHQQERQVSLPSALYVAIGVARGLDFAHKHWVVHRDVSPSNILLSQAGEVKIADFGIAEALNKRERKSQRGGRIMGKWRYMSPEQTRGESISIASDVFAAAAVMYELFVGEKLFPGSKPKTIIDNIHSMSIPLASSRRDDLPKRVDEILSRALERDPAKRPSASTMLRELLEISYESSIVASPLGVSDAVTEALKQVCREQPTAHLDLNALIRDQIADGGQTTTVRKTSIDGDSELGFEPTQTAQTIVHRAVGGDGVTVLALEGAFGVEGTPLPILTARITEVGQPILLDKSSESEQVKESVEPISKGADLVGLPRDRLPPARQPSWLLVVALLVTAGLGAAAAWLARSNDNPIEKLPVAVGDAGAIAIAPTTLTVESEPSGAEVLINNVVHSQRTPFTVQLSAEIPYQLELRLSGYESAQENVVLKPRQDLRIRPRLAPLRSTLEVITRPSGAIVYLDGQRIGLTPLYNANLQPGVNRQLRIEKKSFRTVTVTVDLAAHQTVLVNRVLSSTVRYAVVNIDIENDGRSGWAFVYLKGKRLGRAPGSIRLPVGPSRLVLRNTHTGASRVVSVNVSPAAPGGLQRFRFRLSE